MILIALKYITLCRASPFKTDTARIYLLEPATLHTTEMVEDLGPYPVPPLKLIVLLLQTMGFFDSGGGGFGFSPCAAVIN